MQENDMAELSAEEIDKIERVNESFERRADAEAALESQRKLRVLFERTAQEALPFVVYVVYMGAMGLLVVFKLLDFDGAKLWVGSGLVFTIMVAPLLILPRASWAWARGAVARRLDSTTEARPTTKGRQAETTNNTTRRRDDGVSRP